MSFEPWAEYPVAFVNGPYVKGQLVYLRREIADRGPNGSVVVPRGIQGTIIEFFDRNGPVETVRPSRYVRISIPLSPGQKTLTTHLDDFVLFWTPTPPTVPLSPAELIGSPGLRLIPLDEVSNDDFKEMNVQEDPTDATEIKMGKHGWLRQHVISYVTAHPGSSAKQITQGLRQQALIQPHSDSVASTLLREFRAGNLKREVTGGPKAPWVYFPVTPSNACTEPQKRMTFWERLRINPFEDE